MSQNDVSLIRRSSFQAVLAGAAAGGVVSYLFFTPSGRQACGALVQALDAFSSEWARLSHAVSRAQLAAVEGLKALDGVELSGSRR